MFFKFYIEPKTKTKKIVECNMGQIHNFVSRFCSVSYPWCANQGKMCQPHLLKKKPTRSCESFALLCLSRLGCEIKANLTSNLWFFLVNVKIPNNDNKCYHLRSISIKMYSVNSLIWNSAEMKKNKKNYGKLVSNRVFSFSCMINGLSSFSFSVTFFLK